MGVLVWLMVGLALWHFTVFLPDRFYGGIVGSFLACCIGAVVFGAAVHGFDVPGNDDTDMLTALECIPGVVIALAITWVIGTRQERLDAEARGGLAPRR